MYLGVHTIVRSLNFKPYGVILILREGNNSICIVLTACKVWSIKDWVKVIDNDAGVEWSDISCFLVRPSDYRHRDYVLKF